MSNVLFGDPTFEVIEKAPRRLDVEVPKEILEKLEKARALRQRIIWPVRDEIHAAAMADVLYAAGDQLNASVLPAAGNYQDGKFVRVKDWTDLNNLPTHLRVTVGQRRGKKGHPDDQPANTETA
jgi:hypothetical protein